MSKQEKIPGVIQFPVILQCSPQAEGSYHCRCDQPRVNFKKRENKKRDGEGEREKKRRGRGRERKDIEEGEKVLT